jgi:hypothetical protein
MTHNAAFILIAVAVCWTELAVTDALSVHQVVDITSRTLLPGQPFRTEATLGARVQLVVRDTGWAVEACWASRASSLVGDSSFMENV